MRAIKTWLNPLPDEAVDTSTGWDTRPVITPEALTAWRLRMREHRLLSTGAMRSRHHGSGMTAGEARTYVAGDDPRLMDWALLARTTHAYVRPPQHEPEEGVAILIDASTPMAFGDDTSKLLWAAEWACWLSAWLESQHYRYDVMLWQPEPSKATWKHWRQQTSRRPTPLPSLIDWLYHQLQQAETQAWEGHNPPECPWFPIASLQSVIKPYRHGILLSDFAPHMNAQTEASWIHTWLDALGPLSRRHRWHIAQVQHPLETHLSPHLAQLPLKSMATEEQQLGSFCHGLGSAIIDAFDNQQQQRQKSLTQAFQSAGFAITRMTTDTTPVDGFPCGGR